MKQRSSLYVEHLETIRLIITICTLFSDIIMPKYLMLLCSKKHFSALVYRSLNWSLFSTSLTNHLCSFKHIPNIKMSFKYTITSLMQIKSPSILFIILWNVAGCQGQNGGEWRSGVINRIILQNAILYYFRE